MGFKWRCLLGWKIHGVLGLVLTAIMTRLLISVDDIDPVPFEGGFLHRGDAGFEAAASRFHLYWVIACGIMFLWSCFCLGMASLKKDAVCVPNNQEEGVGE